MLTVPAWVLPVPVSVQTLAPVTSTTRRAELQPFDVSVSVDAVDGESIRSDERAQLNLAESLSLLPAFLARYRLNQAQDMQLSVRFFGARFNFWCARGSLVCGRYSGHHAGWARPAFTH